MRRLAWTTSRASSRWCSTSTRRTTPAAAPSRPAGFRDNIASVQGHGAVVLGVSPDGVDSHNRFSDKLSLNFPLLADEDTAISQAYGVWVQRERDGRKFMGIERSTFLIDPDGIIKKIWRKVDPNEHVPEVLEALKA